MIKQYVCAECGSNDIVFDAIARWNIMHQTWTLIDVADPIVWCENCFEDRNYKEIKNENISSELVGAETDGGQSK